MVACSAASRCTAAARNGVAQYWQPNVHTPSTVKIFVRAVLDDLDRLQLLIKIMTV